ncbi:gamma-glutamylcyclotransferase [Luteolibacter flavescens]|uniref:Gamma-glutamylcyclotransferase n=1 Tax=Luteolibacter flavescens TaxID=1859460 RepID=A0ABT3FX78_9BACT|nr:gamma-glutamylcyclotransferase family protein [Luteolibacter flavescens]MCW1887839.1 gamma-glutamylcyclotransferase [Luteolibacter flavescens]
MRDDSNELVFVYGPLRSGGPECFRMAGAVYVAKGTVPGMLYGLADGPALVSGGEDSARVTGDLYRVTPEHLQKLDDLDGLAPDERETSDRRRGRVAVKCFFNSGDSWTAWAWVWHGPVDPGQRIQSGDWLRESRPGLTEGLQRYPWYSLIGTICLVSFPIWLLAAPLTSYYTSPLARFTHDAMLIGGALSPFAAVYSLWLAKRRGESDRLLGCLYAVALMACGFVVVAVIVAVIKSIRG